MRHTGLIGAALAAALVAGLPPKLAAGSEPPAVVASIPPVGSIAAAIMQGLGEPVVMLAPGASPHAYSLRPSEARALDGADLVLWVGEMLEGFLEGPLQALAGDARIIELVELPGMTLLSYREGTFFEAPAHDDDHAHEHDAQAPGVDGHAHGAVDGHVWLSPANGRVVAAAIAAALSEIDPANAERYAANLAHFDASIDRVEAAITAILEPVKDRPFLVFHDAFHYFEAHFGIEALGAIHINPEVQPGAARIAEIQSRIRELDAVCVFAEPQFEPRIISTLTEKTTARSGVLDPLGSSLAPGPEAYGELLLELAASLADCLEG